MRNITLKTGVGSSPYSYKKKSVLADFWKQLVRSKAAMFGLILFAAIVLMSVIGPLVIPYERAIAQDAGSRLLPPSLQHWFGTDNYGRDIFCRIVHGAKYSLSIRPSAMSLRT